MRKLLSLSAYAIVSVMSIWLLLPAAGSAATITGGQLLLSDPRPTQAANYTFSGANFTTGTNIGCIEVNLNTLANGSGGTPSGITTTSSTLASSTLVTGWSVDNTSNGTLRITNGTPATPNASGNIVWGNVTNGDTADVTYYAIVNTYTTDACTTVVDSTVVTFRYTDGALVELIIEPTLTFTVGSVATSETVNGATTTIASTPTSIDFGNAVTTAVNGISAHALTVDTNAPGGYTVSIRHTGDLSNGSDTIANHTGTYATPTGFAAAGTEAWGYTTGEFAQFVPNLWAGFTTTNETVMLNSSATAGSETSRVGHQVGISSTTPAGTYQTTIIYTVAATY